MGYVPPPRAAELIRQDIEPLLTTLYGLHRVYGWGNTLNRTAGVGYEKYRYDLYGPRPRNWLPVLDAAFVVLLVALAISVLTLLADRL